MRSPHLAPRLRGILHGLKAVHAASAGTSSSASKGRERETFIDVFLRNSLPPVYRFGSGEVIDSGLGGTPQMSNQMDIVVEYPFLPSFPMLGAEQPRLYLAESVVAAIEVKTDLISQWDEVVKTRASLEKLNRKYEAITGYKDIASPKHEKKVPLYVVGYTGWKDSKKLQEKLTNGDADGILVIDSELYEGYNVSETGEWCLLGFLQNLYAHTLAIQVAQINIYNYS